MIRDTLINRHWNLFLIPSFPPQQVEPSVHVDAPSALWQGVPEYRPVAVRAEPTGRQGGATALFARPGLHVQLRQHYRGAGTCRVIECRLPEFLLAALPPPVLGVAPRTLFNRPVTHQMNLGPQRSFKEAPMVMW